ncbi:nucleotide exchange factor GrpE [Conexivisphaera calida]|uniref:nucleotide exchange factor GrpE n=1 Tax=Conexivisphaera calida TaxID=1874277 RepID=UPI00157B691F|nr:nucleotide exchange factor GrpE [Conexivisphaera calida]
METGDLSGPGSATSEPECQRDALERCMRSVAALRSAVVRMHEALERERESELYLRADVENYAKRLEREADAAADRKLEQFITGIIEALDELEIYREAARSAGANSSLIEGLDIILGKLLKSMEGAGLRRIYPMGEEFDPKLHSAVAVERTEEGAGKVVGVLRAGYVFKGKLLRPALVRVGISHDQRG